MYRRFRGASTACPTPVDREIDFDLGFNFDSFVRGGRGEAVCARVRRASLTLGLILVCCPAPRGGFVSNSCCYTHWLLTTFACFCMARAVYSLLHAWVSRDGNKECTVSALVLRGPT